jgi:L-iditol 2-dehydrogenase
MGKAVYLHGREDARVAPFNLREGRPGEVLLDVAAVGVCGSDLHYFKDGGIGSAVIKEPFVPGHEFGGFLCEDIEELALKRGSLVAVDPNKACGHCDWWHEGHPNLCPNVEFIGAPPFDGAMTQRIWVSQSQLVSLPSDFDPLQAVMLEPLGVAIHAVDLAKPLLLERVALLGVGPIGLLILQVLRVAGAGEVLVVDSLEHRREAASKLGAARVGASAEDIVGWTKSGGLLPRHGSHQFASWFPGCRQDGPDRRASDPRRNSGRGHLHLARRGGPPPRAQDQIRPPDG